MRDPDRIPRILEKLRAYWEANPDLRLCQIVSNLNPSGTPDPFYVEDDVIEKALDKESEEIPKPANLGRPIIHGMTLQELEDKDILFLHFPKGNVVITANHREPDGRWYAEASSHVVGLHRLEDLFSLIMSGE